MKVTEIKILRIALTVFVITSIYFGYKHYQFPVEYVICSDVYEDCFASARFTDMRACQRAREAGNWLCDSTDPNNIQCKVSKDSTAVGYCRD